MLGIGSLRVSNRQWAAAAFLLLSLAVSGCARVASPEQASSSTPPVIDDPGPIGIQPDWDHPIVASVRVTSEGQAQNLVNFSLRSPTGLSTGPAVITTSDPVSVVRNDMAVAWVFKASAYGVFNVIEQLAQVSAPELAELVNLNGTSTTKFSLVDVAPGVQGVMQEGPVSTALDWIDGGVRFTILGPAESFTTSAALDLAQGMYS